MADSTRTLKINLSVHRLHIRKVALAYNKLSTNGYCCLQYGDSGVLCFYIEFLEIKKQKQKRPKEKRCQKLFNDSDNYSVFHRNPPKEMRNYLVFKDFIEKNSTTSHICRGCTIFSKLSSVCKFSMRSSSIPHFRMDTTCHLRTCVPQLFNKYLLCTYCVPGTVSFSCVQWWTKYISGPWRVNSLLILQDSRVLWLPFLHCLPPSFSGPHSFFINSLC